MAANRTIFIAGAGIAGLTLALALAKFGARVVVVERNTGIQEYGAGLQISPNARHVLNQLGLDAAVEQLSFEPEGIDLLPLGADQPLTTLQLGDIMRQRFGASYAVMHRADLAELLFRATRRFANIEVVFGVDGFQADEQETGVSIAFAEPGGHARQARAFALVGADGLHSRVRTELLSGPSPQWLGAVAWRTLIDMEAIKPLVSLDRVSLLFGPGFHIVCYPLPHRGQVNIALFNLERVKGEPNRTAPQLPIRPGKDGRVDGILTLARGNWGYWPMGIVNAPCWHQGAIGLVGDASHAMLPFQAQGAAMAIEDAAVLAPLLVKEDSAESAFARYESLRRPRVARVARTAKANGSAFHMRWPMSAARDLVLKMQGSQAHLKRLRWLYGYDATAALPH